MRSFEGVAMLWREIDRRLSVYAADEAGVCKIWRCRELSYRGCNVEAWKDFAGYGSG